MTLENQRDAGCAIPVALAGFIILFLAFFESCKGSDDSYTSQLRHIQGQPPKNSIDFKIPATDTDTGPR